MEETSKNMFSNVISTGLEPSFVQGTFTCNFPIDEYINFKGKSTVTTKLGSLCSLVTIGLGIAYLSTLIIKLINSNKGQVE